MRRFILAAVACVLAIAPAAAETKLDELPAALKPTGLTPYLEVPATGVQIYTCGKNDAGAPAWVFKAPEAQLNDTQKKQIGKHYAGPSWEGMQGGKIVGAAKANAPGAVTIAADLATRFPGRSAAKAPPANQPA